jgi:hypothetical protein
MDTVRATADRLKLYALRETLNLYDLACLAHGADPERVSDRAWLDVREHRRTAHGWMSGPTPVEVAELIGAIPETILGDQIGSTLKALCIATGGNFQRAVTIAQARRLLGALGLDLPPELGATEGVSSRQLRCVARFRALGGDMRMAGTGWQCSGSRGALAELVREEAAAGRPRSDKNDIRSDLIAAIGAHWGS